MLQSLDLRTKYLAGDHPYLGETQASQMQLSLKTELLYCSANLTPIFSLCKGWQGFHLVMKSKP